MTINVLFFASLREAIGQGSVQLNAEPPETVADIWKRATKLDIPANTFAALNQVNSKMNAAVNDGDEVAFFPPVTGG